MKVITLKNQILLFSASLILLALIPLAASDASETQRNSETERLLREGKICLDRGEYDNAINILTAASEKLPILADYALLWRAKAYENKGDIDNAVSDLKTIKDKYRDSPLIKNIRITEIELLRKKNNSDMVGLFESFIKDYPSEFSIKYAYAAYLKENNNSKAKELFKEIFISTSPLSKSALNELSSSDIAAEDFIKRGKNLNNAWLFVDAEKSFREALHRIQKTEHREQKQEDGKLLTHNSELKTEILEGLAYSVFRQKRYRESAELYKQVNNFYWKARSIFRAGDMETFESDLSNLMETGDKRIASILIAYGTKKRREGNTEEALKIFNSILSKYPSKKEEALWAKGWTYYMSRDCKNAREVFSQLYGTYGDSKYLYWKNKCTEMLKENSSLPKKEKIASSEIKDRNTMNSSSFPKKHRDFYAFLSMLKNSNKSSVTSGESIVTNNELNRVMSQELGVKSPEVHNSKLITLNSNTRHSSLLLERIDILTDLGFKHEAALELIHLSKKNPDMDRLIYLSSYLKKLGSYKTSVNLISRVSYTEELHELFYPMAFSSEIEEASKKNSIDQILILAVIREESRFDPDARSIAGALGLMQLMPHTAHRFTKVVKFKHSSELHDARTNILIGSFYLKQLLKTFNSIPVALAAYNAGEDAVKEWLRNGSYNTIDEFIEDIPYDETRNYVKKVLTTYFEYMRTSRDIDVYAAQKYIGNL